MKSLLVYLLILNAISAFASVEINKDLQQFAINNFLSNANNPTSDIGITIAKINEETADGRNNEGTIKTPVKDSDLQIIFLSGEILFNPWKYGEKNESETACNGYSETASFLIFLSQYSIVHGASEYSTVTFKVETKKMVKAEYKDGRKIEYCSDFADESQTNLYKFLEPELVVENISHIEMETLFP